VIVLAGDSGTGKTALAESLGDPLARSLGVKLCGYRMGPDPVSGGLLERALNPTSCWEEAGIQPNPMVRGYIFIYDQHYVLGTVPMDGRRRGGDPPAVSQVLQAAETLAARGESAAVIVCVSHPSQIDPAVRRLSLEPFLLTRPDAAQREIVLRRLTDGLSMTDAELVRLVRATGPREGTPGYTYGDLVQRLIRVAILESYPARPLTAATLVAVARRLSPTPTACATKLESPQPPSD
jgi:SpoVK/Ycf46/Vps4 family AAA+-type ATPase